MDADEQRFAAALARMDRLRKLLRDAGNIIVLAEVDAWYRQHAKVIRAIRDKAEEAEWDS